MELRVIVLYTIVLHLITVIAGNDIITFNPDLEESMEDNIDELLEKEHFIQVVDKRRRTQPQPPNRKIQQHEPSSDQSAFDSYNDVRHADAGNQLTSATKTLTKDRHRLDTPYPLRREVTVMGENKARNSSVFTSEDAFGRGGARVVQWEELSMKDLGERDEEEFIFMDEMLLPVDGFGGPLSRSKRALTAGSGESVTEAQITLDGTLTTDQATDGSVSNLALKAAIASALKTYLESFFTGYTFTIEVTLLTSPPSGSIVVDFDILTVEEITPRQLAQSLYDLDTNDNFKVGSVVHTVSKPTLEPSDGATQEPAICFLCENYERCEQRADETWYCLISDNRFYTYGTTQGDSKLPPDEEFVVAEIEVDSSIPYGQDMISSVFISVNGIISFGEEFASFSPEPLPVTDPDDNNRKILAVYWSDLDLLADNTAEVYYQLYTKSATNTPAQRAIFAKANSETITYSGDQSTYDATTVIVATWAAVPPWPAQTSLSERVTFQCVIISDGQTTYAMYLYGSGAMNFDPVLERPVEIGWGDTNFDNTRDNYYIFDTVLGNTNTLGRWFFKIGEGTNSRGLCLSFYNDNLPFLAGLILWNQILPPCPCNEVTAALSVFWIPSFEQARCYDIFPIFGQIGRRCCYRLDNSFAFENRIPLAGSLQLFTPYYGDFVNHELQDTMPKRWCCDESDLCQLYYVVRPGRACVAGRSKRGLFFGDPHITTLDGRTYIFNGLGEYRLFEIDGMTSENITVNFKMQARTCRAVTSNGSLSDATVFCAIAVENTNGTSLRVEMNPTSTYMIIYTNDQDYTTRFRDNSGFSAFDGGIWMQRVNDSLKLSTPDNIGFTITLKNKLLDFSVELDVKYRNMVRGLLGNFNNDGTDDFIFPNGTQLPSSASERDLFYYGQTWAVTQADSIFQYTNGQNTSSFSDSNFVPIFLDEADPAVRAEAETVCNSNTNLPCIFDYIATRNAELAVDTKQSITEFEEQEAQASNQPPSIYGTNKIYVTVNETTNFTLNANDTEDSSPQFIVVNNPGDSVFTYSIDGNTLTASYTPTNLSSASIGIAAKDNGDLQSEVAEIEILSCSGCSGHGICNFTRVRKVITPYYSVATCICEAPYSGVDCEKDKNGCAQRPCPLGTICTDVPAADEPTLGFAYNCSGCPTGYSLNGTKCEDINECAASPNPCGSNAVCTNTNGGYTCRCISGYRKSSANRCIDINECVENQYQCAQICINTVGSYNCSCEEGFQETGIGGYNCTKLPDKDPCANLSQANPCEYGCRNDSGKAECFCEIGKRVAPNGYSCEDINECNENLCSQACENSDGSYTCSCYAGYLLAEDKLSCDECAENKYGMNCNKTCNCRGRATGCDRVKGCLCTDSWTGPSCEVDVDECVTIPNACPSDQNCVNTNGSYICVCPVGYENTYSNGSCYNINECASPSISKCPQDCVDNPGSFACVCRDGYNYIPANNTCQDINECTSGVSGCQQICVNKEGSYNCECRLGFLLGEDRKSCVKDLDPCRDFNLNCSYACNLVSGVPECYCQIGFQLATDNINCLDINECVLGTHKCTDTCINTQGSYNCSCPDGKELQNDKRTCEKCDDYHWGPNCDNECACDPKGTVHCDPVTGCVCTAGWQGEKCSQDKDECSSLTSPCPEFATCTNTAGSYVCRCSSGFQLQNGKCEDIDECTAFSPCDHNCSNTIGSYTCSCFSSGFKSVGDDCIDINECAVPELNGCDQLCRNTQGGFACECYEGYLLNTTTRNTCYVDPATTCSESNKCSDFCGIENSQEVCFCRPGYELDTDNTTCIDIDECLNNDPCINGTCNNQPGKFNCTCAAGTKLAGDKVTCQVCDSGFFGQDCADSCTCNVTNTVSCDPTNGDCNCLSGWTGDCSQNIDECTTLGVDCGANAECQDSPGSYRCVCDVGYFRSGDQCIECDATHYGQDCLNTCSCVQANTVDCNNVNGTCTCKPGWTNSTSCAEDIDECNETDNYCPGVHDTCFNLNGSAECRCDTGYEKPDSSSDCQDINECQSPTLNTCQHPKECNNTDGSHECVCKEGYLTNGDGSCTDIDECQSSTLNTCQDPEECNNTDGSFECVCKEGYSRNAGGLCTDINECQSPTLNTCQHPKECNNTDGSFECVCKEGYLTNADSSCTANFQSYHVTITLGFTDTQIDDNIFNSTTDEFRELAKLVQESLFNYGRGIIRKALLTVIITRFYRGSVVADTTVEIDQLNSDNPPGDAAKLIHAYATAEELTIDGQQIDVTNVTVNGSTVGSSTGTCDILNQLDPCNENEECVEVDGLPSCQPTDSEDSNKELIIGLGVGVPLFFILTVTIALLVYFNVKRKSKEDSRSSTPSVEHDAPFRSIFATQMATKGSWGAPHRMQMYSPDAYSEAGTSESSGNGQLLKSRQKGRSDFQDSPWYDNRGGATPRDPAESRGAPTEAAGPTSNFSWEYMFKLLEPHKGFEIQRPAIDPSPNPTYTPRTNKRPDSMA